ncbi:MAG TPA: alpha-2-macroglobulin family protein, partial [Longimicrobiales bacterium]
GQWRNLATTSYQVAEYRPPEFLVDVNADNQPRFAGDVVNASVSARYLFGAPMARARVRYVVQHRPMWFWELDIPGTEGWEIGGYDDADNYDRENESVVAQEGVDSLDARGNLELQVKMPVPKGGRPARTGILAVVTDANRQTVSAGRSIIVHPAAFYIGAKTRGEEYFWRAGKPVDVDVITLRPNGERVSGVNVQGVVVRREWHQVRRIRSGQVSDVGNWVSDTITTCRVQTAAEPVSCRFTPSAGGSYMVAFTATDANGRVARTTMWRWAAGPEYVPWRDDSKLRMQIIADKQRYTVGDTATLLVASPFTDVEAWVTIERERVLQSRRMRITSGATTIKVPITEGLAPNAYVSVLLVRGRSAAPGPVDDPGRPALRVGYPQLRVVPDVKKLKVEVAPLQREYRPGETAAVALKITDAKGVGHRSEVTLWAVDEGVLALTGYKTPDPVELLYAERPLGVRLASNLTAVAAQVPEGQKGRRNPGGGGGADVAGVLRSRFQTTAFFIGSVVTNAGGTATVRARLPDNLTTFRIMAVAVTAGDRYGSGQSSMLVTRPLLARPSLPRFVREGDRFSAGVVVNQRTAGTQRVDVEATARGIAMRGAQKKTETLNGAVGREVRFDFTAQNTDSAHFQFAVRGTSEVDAVAVRIPVKENYHPLAQTIAGTVRDTSVAEFTLEQDIDPARSTLEISFGSSTMAVMRGARRTLRVYPYYCLEQVASTALPLIALYRAQKELGGTTAPVTAEEDIRLAIRTITRRQNPDGGIGYWTSNDWSSPWLTAYTTRVLLEAREAGFTIDNNLLNRVAEYLTASLHRPMAAQFAIARWLNDQKMILSERVAAVDILSRLGKPDVAVENSLLAQAGQLGWEDRVLLAEVFARRGATAQAKQLLANAWANVTFSGRTLSIPATDTYHYFRSSARPAARLLMATLVVEPNHQYLGQLVETLVRHGRAAARDYWNTQDYGSTVLALMAFERRRQQNQGGTIQFAGARGTLLSRTVGAGEIRDTSFALTGLVRGNTVRVNVSAQSANPIYYFLTIREVPRVRAVRPVDRGIQVERWYERVDARTPVTRVSAGELVRVRLRITIPDERHFVILDDPLPAGLEAVDLSLRTVAPPGVEFAEASPSPREEAQGESWYYGSWDSGVWSAFDYKELRDDRVIYFATYLWKGTYTATYLARATTAGTFFMPPAHAEEMYNPAVNGRTGGGEFVVTEPAR